MQGEFSYLLKWEVLVKVERSWGVKGRGRAAKLGQSFPGGQKMAWMGEGGSADSKDRHGQGPWMLLSSLL